MQFKEFYTTLTNYVDEVGCLFSPEGYIGSHKITSTFAIDISNEPFDSWEAGGEVVGWFISSDIVNDQIQNNLVFRIVVGDAPIIGPIQPTYFANLKDFYIAFKNFVETTDQLTDNSKILLKPINNTNEYIFQQFDIDQLGGCGCWAGITLDCIRVMNVIK